MWWQGRGSWTARVSPGPGRRFRTPSQLADALACPGIPLTDVAAPRSEQPPAGGGRVAPFQAGFGGGET